MNESAIILGALLSGFLTSFHCVGMCGPLTCGLLKKGTERPLSSFLFQYHTGRLISYGTLGALAGSMGMVFFEGIPYQAFKVVAWFFVFVYAFIAWGWEWKPKPGSWFFKTSLWVYPWMMRFQKRSALP